MNIKNETLKDYLQTILNKSITNITPNDLLNIERITLTGTINNDSNLKLDLSDIALFPNLKELNISNAYLSINDLESLNNYPQINHIYISGCMLEKGNFTLNIKSLELIDSYIEDYQFLTNLTNLTELVIHNPYTETEIDLSYLSNLSNLNKLVLNRCLINNLNSLSNLTNLSILSVLWTNLPLDYINTINNMPNLKQLYISDEYDTNSINKSITIKNDLKEYSYDN